MARRRSSLAGTNLYLDPRTGNYIWRRVHERTGKRVVRSTRSNHLTIAIRRAAEFEDAYQRTVAGLDAHDGWKLELLPLVGEWLDTVRAGEPTREKYRAQVTRAAERLGILRLADLDDVGRLEGALARLHLRPVTAVRTVQKPLKQLSRWLADKRVIDRDPLAGWRLLEVPREDKRPRRAFRPDEVARALEACRWLDRGRPHPQRPLFLALLVSAARVGAVIECHVDRERGRLDLGADVRNKRRGEAALDAVTLAELPDRFRAPLGGVPRVENVLDDWREAFGVGLALELGLGLEEAWRVAHYLATDSAAVPGNLPPDLREAREREVRVLADPLREEWHRRMVGVDVHALRVTHRTWGDLAGVHPLVLDKQLGHSSRVDVSVLASPVGRKHYIDPSLVEARRAAEAVRKILDEALSQVFTEAWHTGIN